MYCAGSKLIQNTLSPSPVRATVIRWMRIICGSRFPVRITHHSYYCKILQNIKGLPHTVVLLWCLIRVRIKPQQEEGKFAFEPENSEIQISIPIPLFSLPLIVVTRCHTQNCPRCQHYYINEKNINTGEGLMQIRAITNNNEFRRIRGTFSNTNLRAKLHHPVCR